MTIPKAVLRDLNRNFGERIAEEGLDFINRGRDIGREDDELADAYVMCQLFAMLSVLQSWVGGDQLDAIRQILHDSVDTAIDRAVKTQKGNRRGR
jgi:hypothetical protein